jgi:putative oxidoreductase
MFDAISKNTVVPLLLRVGLAVVFIFHGLGKVSADKNWGSGWHPGDMATPLQAAVAWGELLGGVALLIGFLTRIAALGIIGIMAGAIITVHGEHGFAAPKGYEYNFVLIVMALAVVLLGPGTLALDRVLRIRRKTN